MGVFSWFTSRKAVSSVDLEDLIFEVAEYQRDRDLQALYSRMRGRGVFVPVDPSSLPSTALPGQTITTDSSMLIRMRSVSAPDGNGALATCATREDSPILRGGYVGMTWLGLLEMSLKVDPPLRGVLLQGHRSWVALDLARVRHILRRDSSAR